MTIEVLLPFALVDVAHAHAVGEGFVAWASGLVVKGSSALLGESERHVHSRLAF